MYKLIAFAVLAFFFMFSMFYFAPNFKLKQKKVTETEKETILEENIISNDETKEISPLSNISINQNFKFEKLSGPRNDALSHRMDEKYFIPFDVNSYDEMHMNLQERLVSLSEAKMKSEKSKRLYDEN